MLSLLELWCRRFFPSVSPLLFPGHRGRHPARMLLARHRFVCHRAAPGRSRRKPCCRLVHRLYTLYSPSTCRAGEYKVVECFLGGRLRDFCVPAAVLSSCASVSCFSCFNIHENNRRWKVGYQVSVVIMARCWWFLRRRLQKKRHQIRTECTRTMNTECPRPTRVCKQRPLPLPPTSYPLLPLLAGKVFVEYESKESAQKAALSLAGRQFAQNIVKVEYVNEEKFARRDLE